jgi:hypothetical protein
MAWGQHLWRLACFIKLNIILDPCEVFSYCWSLVHQSGISNMFRKHCGDVIVPILSEKPMKYSTSQKTLIRKMDIQGSFAKFVDSSYYSKSELCGGVVTVSFSKYLPWQVMHFLQCSTHFSKMCCRPFITL